MASLIDPLGSTDAAADLFGDAAVLQSLLDVETAMARAQARLGVIPAAAAEAIAAEAVASHFDGAALAEAARGSGTVAVPLVSALTARVRARDADASKFVHWGATSQDIVDTAMVLLVTRAQTAMRGDYGALAEALADLSNRYAATVMPGRTLLQPAVPITFGLKVAGWFDGARRTWRQLEAAVGAAAVVQFGGAAGTLASLGDRGPDVAEALAGELGLAAPAAPWHSLGDRAASVVAACGLFTGMLGKMARDVVLLMQAEVAEASEPGGGSSTMPQKRNPAGCAVALAAAIRLPGLVSSSLAALVQDHERGAGTWHAQWPIVAEALRLTMSAVQAMREVAASLEVDKDRMRANIEATHGAMLSERVMMRIAPQVGRERAHELLRQALERARHLNEPLDRAIGDIPELSTLLSDEDRTSLDDPLTYLGPADVFRRRLLED